MLSSSSASSRNGNAVLNFSLHICCLLEEFIAKQNVYQTIKIVAAYFTPKRNDMWHVLLLRVYFLHTYILTYVLNL